MKTYDITCSKCNKNWISKTQDLVCPHCKTKSEDHYIIVEYDENPYEDE